jgi:outer membrane receptor protein involved in Fe transport
MKLKVKPVVRGLSVAFGGLMIVSANAQQQPQVQEEVVVTGTRIRTPGAESPSPLQVITSQEIEATGAVNLQDVLLLNPVVGAPTIARTNSTFATASSGVATVDLRNLGTSRTLVLVNGRRHVAGIPGDSAVDLNAIPADFIERIEILSGGASSLYGSDAVAGVVNIILKRNFEGLALDASYGQSGEGDDTRTKVSATWGASLAGGKGNVMLHAGYSRQGSVFARDRDISTTDNIPTAFLTGEAADIQSLGLTSPFYSSFAPQGRIFINPGVSSASRTFDAQGNIIPWSTNGPAGDGVGATGFNRQAARALAIPTERYLLAGTAEYEFAPNHRAFVEGTFAATNTKAELEPFPLDPSDSVNGIYPATGVIPAEFRYNGQLLKNPVVPQGIYDLLTQRNDDGALVYSFSRRLTEIGNRGATNDRDTFRILPGIKGAITANWDYEAYAGYGQTKESQVSGGQVNVLNFKNALEAIPDVDDLNGNGNTTEAICLDANARAQGCVPISIFGFNSITPEAAKYVQAPSLLQSFISQKFIGGLVTGEPMMLPAGPLGVAVGAEYRKEYSRSEFDALQQAGLNAGNAIPRTEGDFDVSELFGEVKVPLLKDAPFAKSLSVGGAARWSDYSTVGNTFSWNAGLEWAPISNLRFRFTGAQSTRAPNIAELYTPPSQDFPSVIDPCEGVTATTPGATADACRADPGVAANIAQNGAFTLNQADLQGTSGFDKGNPNLQEEEGQSYTLGLVFTPTGVEALRNTAFTLDYYRIKIDDAIVTTPTQFTLTQCYGGDTSFCQFVQRRQAAVGANSAGSISRVDTTATNSGGVETEGIDFTASYADRVGPGRLNARFSYSYLIEGFVIPLPGSEKDYFAGEIGAPEHRWNLAMGYAWNAFGVNFNFSYIGESSIDDQFLSEFGLPRDSVKIGSKFYTDMQLTYNYKKAQFYFGVDNLFDTSPPQFDTNGLIPVSVENTSTGAATDAGVYDAIGRRWYLGVRMAL